MKQLVILIYCTGMSLTAMHAQPDCALTACCCGTPEQVVIPNGNFEDPPIVPINTFITFFAGDNYSGWNVLSGSIDVLGANSPAFNSGNPNGPSQCIDINGFTNATIATTLTGLMPGCVYTISLWYAKNPGVSSASCTIQIAGGSWLNATWTASNNGSDSWLERCYTFTALASTAELRFSGSSSVPVAGVLLDDITLWKCPKDEQPPVVNNPPMSPLMVECDEAVPAPQDIQPSDNCPGSLDINVTDLIVPQSCFYNITRSWTVTDACGNTTTATQQIQVRDTEPPVFLVPPEDYLANCGDPVLPAFFQWVGNNGNALVEDDCDPSVIWSASYNALPNGTCSTVLVTFTARDDCGNTSSAQATFTVQDDTPPTLVEEAVNVLAPCSANIPQLLGQWLANNGGAVASDPCGPIQWTNNFTGDSTAPLIFVTFIATDFCLNSTFTTALFEQSTLSDTVVNLIYTCDPDSAGTDTVIVIQGLCEVVTILNTVSVYEDTLFLVRSTCFTDSAGVFAYSLQNVFGCDSVVVDSVLLLPSSLDSILLTTCDQDSAGLIVQNFTNQAGCDSIIVYTIGYVPPDSTFRESTSCDSTQAGVFIQRLTGVAGCDSLVVNTVLFSESDTTFISLPTCDPALAGTFIQSFQSVLGCDSVVVQWVSLLPGDTVLLPDTVTCNAAQSGVFESVYSNQYGCDSVTVRTVLFTPLDTVRLSGATCDPSAAGLFYNQYLTAQGCDSVVVQWVSLLPGDTVLLPDTVTCNAAQSGVFESVFTNQYGCDSVTVRTVLFTPLDTVRLSGATCDPSAAGVFYNRYLTAQGCDSVVVQWVTLLPGDTVLLPDTVTCNAAQSGVFESVYTNQYGCDSIAVRTVLYTPLDTVRLSGATCDPSAAGVFYNQYLTAQGCDSVVVQWVSLLPGDTVLLPDTVTCNAAQSGVFESVYTNQYGCDSITVRTVLFTPLDTVRLSGATCDPSAAGVFYNQYLTAQGCDSVVVQWVTLLPGDTVLLPDTVTCNAAQSGVFESVYTNQYGCDSLTVRTVLYTPLDTVWLSGGTCDPSAAGLFYNQYLTAQGCDSVVVTEVQLYPPPELLLTGSNYEGFGVSCAGENDGFIIANPSGASPFAYSWSAGDTNPSITGLPAGDYSLSLTDVYGCTVVASFTLTSPDSLQLTLDIHQPLCIDIDSGSITITPEGGAQPYLFALEGGDWQPEPEFTNLSPGDYRVLMTDANGCIRGEPFTIGSVSGIAVDLGPDRVVELGDQITLVALVTVPADSLSQVEWSIDSLTCPECLSQVIRPGSSGVYSIAVVGNNGCRDADTVWVRVTTEKRIYVPNIFAPDTDGLNGVFYLFAKEGVVQNIRRFVVFDRWGNAVFSAENAPASDPAFGWNGTYKSQPLDPGVFTWYAEVEFIDGTAELLSGDVTLIR